MTRNTKSNKWIIFSPSSCGRFPGNLRCCKKTTGWQSGSSPWLRQCWCRTGQSCRSADFRVIQRSRAACRCCGRLHEPRSKSRIDRNWFEIKAPHYTYRCQIPSLIFCIINGPFRSTQPDVPCSVVTTNHIPRLSSSHSGSIPPQPFCNWWWSRWFQPRRFLKRFGSFLLKLLKFGTFGGQLWNFGCCNTLN